MKADSEKLDFVLLIDDDDVVNTLNTIILRHSGLVKEIQAVKSGDQGLEVLASYQQGDKWPAIIFVDINMPGITGWEFIAKFGEKFAEFKSKCIICMLSSSLDPRDKVKANKSGFVDDFISKPLTMEVAGNLFKKYYDLQKSSSGVLPAE